MRIDAKSYISFINEGVEDHLHVSILAADKYLTNPKRIEEFLDSQVVVEHKTDGIHLTIIKQFNNGDLHDYIFAYKGNILYSTEYDYQPTTKVKKEAIGASQFKTVFEHFNKLPKNAIPVGTELFVEFLMSKPTLSSNYSTKHKMVLIGHSKATWVEAFGKLKTKPQGFDTSLRNEYAKVLKIDVPQLLFSGRIGNTKDFENGIMNPLLQKEFAQRKGSMQWDIPELLLDDIRELFLAIESKYGGKEEGVVIKYNGMLLKFQQEYQLDQKARADIKDKYREADPQQETKYWDSVKRVALELANNIVVKSRKLDDILADLSIDMKRLKLDFKHSKKTEAIIKDDIQLNVKTLIIKKMRGNNNALIIGKFRVLTKEGHYKLIKRAQTLYDNVVVCLVTSNDTKETKDLREKMIRLCFPKVEIIHSSNGNLITILGKSSININVVYAGSDRVREYQEQLKHNIGMGVRELERTDNDISASKVIAEINNEELFKKNTPKEIHAMYNDIKKAYNG